MVRIAQRRGVHQLRRHRLAGDKDIYFTHARPYKSNDNAHVEQKNGDVVRRHAFHYRCYTTAELKLLNAFYALIRVRLNLFTATTKAIGWRSNKHGKKTWIYDKPRIPYHRGIDSGILTEAKATELADLIGAVTQLNSRAASPESKSSS
ncbi:hypothetical protein [Paenarthrobacter sp. A20]|uniref:hypothetical protein n=1 Tax=Paenarthrobacter sp. A20 TaxID=2817891 RepID=UPI00209DD42F|nr:hypothetical protein [Paenarthrobacter sp. A20]MCP1410835.1 hypothetical protein [Paenarthrobacter sp. A20]